GRLLCGSPSARGSVYVIDQAPCPCEAVMVRRARQDFKGLFRLVDQRVLLSFTFGHEAELKANETSSGLQRDVLGLLSLADRRKQIGVGQDKVADFEQRFCSVQPQSRTEWIRRRQQNSRPLEQVGGGMHVGSHDCALAGCSEVLRSAFAELDGMGIQRAQSAQNEERLLEVIPADLLELHDPVRVRTFYPIDECFVKLSARSLEHSAIVGL